MAEAHSKTSTSLVGGVAALALTLALALGGLGALGVGVSGSAGASTKVTFLSRLGRVTQVASTVPANGDVNPYGIAEVTQTTGSLVMGDTLVSNFNDKANVQGTGSTIEEIAPSGSRSQFAHVTSANLPAGSTCPGGIGLSTALSILPDGYVVVGSVPAGLGGALPLADPAGCLIVLNSSGTPVAAWSNPDINGPWDMTATATATATGAEIFVANVLSRPAGATTTPASGLCTVVRLDIALPAGGTPQLTSSTVIGSALPWKANKAAFILGPTGVALAGNGTLYVVETLTNQILDISEASSRTTAAAYGTDTLSKGHWLNAPLGLIVAPDGNLIAVNGNNGVATEITLAGRQITHRTLVRQGAGDLFGLTVTPNGRQLLFVNDGTNALDRARI